MWFSRVGEGGVGGYLDYHATGWGHIFGFIGLSDLLATLERHGLRGRVSKLGIVAHGSAGVVLLDPPLTPASVLGHYAHDLAELCRFLTPEAWLTFYACRAGEGPEGSDLLMKLSGALPGRTIVAFVLYGYVDLRYNTPGEVEATEWEYAPAKKEQNLGYLHPWCRWAKRAKDGKIVHIPILEQNGRPNKRCANPNCPGHGGESPEPCRGW